MNINPYDPYCWLEEQPVTSNIPRGVTASSFLIGNNEGEAGKPPHPNSRHHSLVKDAVLIAKVFKLGSEDRAFLTSALKNGWVSRSTTWARAHHGGETRTWE